MSGSQLIALFTLSVFWLSSFSYGGATDIFGEMPSSVVRLEKSKFVQLPNLARTEQVKVGAKQDNSPEKTPVHWLHFTTPALKLTWKIFPGNPRECAHRLAPSLTGIVVLQI
ncbi:MAG: hypothetical protein QM715_02820 [Nibricoccus sp.]